jgi:AraC-like DNA-binding protein
MDYAYDHVRLTPDKQIGAHRQPGYELSYIITGRGIRTLGTVTEPFSEGEVVLVPPGLLHHWSFDPACVDRGGCIENITFHFTRPFLERIVAAFPDLSNAITNLLEMTEAVKYQGNSRQEIIGLLSALDGLPAGRRPSGVISLLSAASDLKHTAKVSSLSGTGPAEKRMDKVRIYVSCNFRNRITIEEIASYAGMNRSAFCSFFKKQTGTTFITWLNRYRIERACEMLSYGDVRVGEVAAACGFESLPHFSRVFRSIKGVPPTGWTAR